jgi:hypothetical protein
MAHKVDPANFVRVQIVECLARIEDRLQQSNCSDTAKKEAISATHWIKTGIENGASEFHANPVDFGAPLYDIVNQLGAAANVRMMQESGDPAAYHNPEAMRTLNGAFSDEVHRIRLEGGFI